MIKCIWAVLGSGPSGQDRLKIINLKTFDSFIIPVVEEYKYSDTTYQGIRRTDIATFGATIAV